MRRSAALLVSILSVSAVLVLANAARASSDMEYTPDFSSLTSPFTSRNVRGALLPQNDTRDNLVFLLADRRKQVLNGDPFATGSASDGSGSTYWEGTICVSDASGREGFLAAVAADGTISASEKQALQQARQALACEEGQGGAQVALPAMQSAAARDFAAYLAAVTQFYKVSHVDPAAFSALAGASQPWVREAARYMEARIALLAAQVTAFDDYGTLDRASVDAGRTAAAKAALDAYLKEYPQGAYAASAKGLTRRAHWLANDRDGQATAYGQLLLAENLGPHAMPIINELDLKLDGEAYFAPQADPVLVAVQLLRLLRPKTDAEGKPVPGMSAADMDSFKPRFAGNEELFAYLQALRAWTVDHDSASVLALLPEKTVAGDISYLDFSRQILRAKAMASKNDAGTRPLLEKLSSGATQFLQRPTLELELASFDERHKNLSAIFAKDSLIRDPAIRMRVLDYVAGPIILRQEATNPATTQEERDTALFRLLVRDITQGRYKGFVEDIKLLPPPPPADENGYVADRFSMFRPAESETGYPCPAIAETAATLARNPKDIPGRLCLGDFLRGRNYEIELPEIDKDDLGGTGTVFAGKPVARQDFYASIMDDPSAKKTDRAYALFRAIHCYAPVGQNDCGGADASKAQRRAWFKELKSRYGDTEWSKRLDVYW